MKQPRIINIRRIYKKLSKKANLAREELLEPIIPTRNKYDYAWKRTKSNPFAENENIKNNYKRNLQLFIILFSFSVSISLLIYNNAFHITNIEVSGLKRIENSKIIDSVYASLAYKKFLILPSKSFILTDISEIKEILKEKFPIESIEIKKNFPNKLSIVIKEKISTVIFDNGKQYAYIGLDGKVIEVLRLVGHDEWIRRIEVVSSTSSIGEEILEERIIEENHKPPVPNIILEMGDYPIVYIKNPVLLQINDIVIREQIILNIISWYNILEKQTDIPFAYIEILNEVGDSIIYTKEGWYILVRLGSNTDEQFKRLLTVLNNKIQRSGVGYIDVRFNNKVFWQ